MKKLLKHLFPTDTNVQCAHNAYIFTLSVAHDMGLVACTQLESVGPNSPSYKAIMNFPTDK